MLGAVTRPARQLLRWVVDRLLGPEEPWDYVSTTVPYEHRSTLES